MADTHDHPRTIDEPEAPSGTDYSDHPTESLARCVDQLHGIGNATLAELFSVLNELKKRDEFLMDGAKDAAGWLQVRLGLSYATAARWADIAEGLARLPHLREDFASGRLSLDKVAVAIELATPESDKEVAEEARTVSVRALQVAARRKEQVSPDLEERARIRRRVWWKWRDGGTRLQLGGSLTAEQGSRITNALERLALQMPDRDSDGHLSLAQRRADALDALSSVQIASDADQDRATFVVHAELETLRTGMGSGWTEEGGLLSAEVISKLLCDARIKLLVEDERGKPLGVGRTMRTAPHWMRVALKARDHTCSFPGCDRTDFLVPHHLEEWREGGPTDPDNLPLVCPTHHALAHKADWHMEKDPSGGYTWIGPRGPVRDGPPPLDYDVKKWLWKDLYRPGAHEVLPDRPPHRRGRKERKRRDDSSRASDAGDPG